LELNFKKNTEFIIPEEFQNKFDEKINAFPNNPMV
jgi:uncharacterized protein YdeI (YjbR/CyaY-like superfamily)